MNIFQKMFSKRTQAPRSEPLGMIYPTGSLMGYTFDGELEPGALNDVYIYDVDYYTLARRAYTLITTNEFARILIKRLTTFIVGQGLKLRPLPMRNFLKRVYKINTPEDFSKQIKEYWSLLEDDKIISVTKDSDLHELANIVQYNGLIAGDVLVIKRVIDGNLEYQIVNGLNVYSSRSYGEGKSKDIDGKEYNNKIVDGVEINNKDEPVAYYVVDKNGKENRISARDSKGRLIAWLVPIGTKRLGSPRGYSELGAILQKLHKINSYTNSEVMAAEANSKFAVVVEQEKESNGINPIKGIPGLARGIQSDIAKMPTGDGEQSKEISNLKNTFKRIASALAIFMPKGQKLSSFDTKRPNVNYIQFVDGSIKYVCAAFDIPFEVALMMFSNNFSASRASLKMFEVILEYRRKYGLVAHFYQPIYEQFFELMVLKGYIIAPGYLQLKNDNTWLDNAYTKAKFVGLKIPHIDEVKEVNAVMSKIKAGLTTFENALETLGIQTDFDSLIEQRKLEEEKIKKAGLVFETLFAPDGGNNNDDDTEQDTSYKKGRK